MFGLSESNIITRGNRQDRDSHSTPPDVSLSRNQTNPNLIEDGIDVIDIFAEPDDRYRIEYGGGYNTGKIWITKEGLRELKTSLLDNQTEIPHWIVSSDLPEWFPTPVPTYPPVICEECGDDVLVSAVVTPWLSQSDSRYCWDCWEAIR